MRPYRWLTLAALDGAVLAMSAPAVSDALRRLWRAATSRAPGAFDATGSVDIAAATLAVALVALAAAWLAVALLADLAAGLPGAAGAAARRVRSRLLPRVLQRLLAGALGVGIVAGPVVASASAPPPHGRGTTAPVPIPAWPTDDPIPPPAWPASAPSAEPHAPPRAAAAEAPPAASVRVRPGDSLWAIAARSLPGRRTPARIAAAWPRWWAANRSVIGPNPDLVQPGQVLTAPVGERKELPR